MAYLDLGAIRVALRTLGGRDSALAELTEDTEKSRGQRSKVRKQKTGEVPTGKRLSPFGGKKPGTFMKL